MQLNPSSASRVQEKGESRPQERLTFQDYLKAYDGVEGVRTEWIAGEVAVYPMSNNIRHQRLVLFLASLLDSFLRVKQAGEVLLAGIPMYLGDDKPAREPDVLVILAEHQERIKATYLDGVADVVIEVVSPESDERDHGAKFVEYEAAGVPEYWLIDMLRHEAAMYALGEDGRYHPLQRDTSGRLRSTVLSGFALDPQVLWQEALPGGTELIALLDKMQNSN